MMHHGGQWLPSPEQIVQISIVSINLFTTHPIARVQTAKKRADSIHHCATAALTALLIVHQLNDCMNPKTESAAELWRKAPFNCSANNGKKNTHLRKWEKHIVPFENSSSLNYITQWNWSFWCFKSVGKWVELVCASRFLQTLVDWLHDSNESKTWFCNLSETHEWLKHFRCWHNFCLVYFCLYVLDDKGCANYLQWVTSSDLLPGEGAGSRDFE